MQRDDDRWSARIDDALEDVLPRVITPDFLEQTFCPSRYVVDSEAIQQGFADPVWELFDRGGNRWRGNLFLALLEAFGRSPEAAIEYACVPELLHKGALIVDDIEDDADMRLHGPPIHVQFGTDVAVNAGNFCYFFAQSVLLSDPANLGPAVRNRLLADVTREMARLHLGQTVDIQWQDRSGVHVDLDEYRGMVAAKTGCLFRLPARMAATMAEAGDRSRRHLLRATEELAIAVQITDDRLDAYHSIHGTETFGKARGNDVIEGKITPLVIHAMDVADTATARELARILTTNRPSPDEVDTALEILQETDALAFARTLAADHAARARAAFREVPAFDATALDQLDSFVDLAKTGEW